VPPVVVPPEAPASPAPEPAAEPDIDIAPPSATKVHKRTHRATPPHRRNRWASLGAGESLHGGGVRTSIDIFDYGNWVFGVSSALTTNRIQIEGYPYITTSDGNQLYLPYVDIVDARVLATVGRNFDLGASWHLRQSFGTGVGLTSMTGDAMDQNGWPQHYATRGIVWYSDATLTLAHDLGNEWGLEAGVDTSLFDEKIYMATHEFDRQQLELLMFGGLRHQL